MSTKDPRSASLRLHHDRHESWQKRVIRIGILKRTFPTWGSTQPKCLNWAGVPNPRAKWRRDFLTPYAPAVLTRKITFHPLINGVSRRTRFHAVRVLTHSEAHRESRFLRQRLMVGRRIYAVASNLPDRLARPKRLPKSVVRALRPCATSTSLRCLIAALTSTVNPIALRQVLPANSPMICIDPLDDAGAARCASVVGALHTATQIAGQGGEARA